MIAPYKPASHYQFAQTSHNPRFGLAIRSRLVTRLAKHVDGKGVCKASRLERQGLILTNGARFTVGRNPDRLL